MRSFLVDWVDGSACSWIAEENVGQPAIAEYEQSLLRTYKQIPAHIHGENCSLYLFHTGRKL